MIRKTELTRMHSSRMHTIRSSSCLSWGGGSAFVFLNFPLGCGPGSDPPQFPPWLWAWTRSPSISPLAVGLDEIPLNFPLGCRPGPYPPGTGGRPPWDQEQTPQNQEQTPGTRTLPPGTRSRHPLRTRSRACWDTTCNVCWDSTPPVNRMTDRQA